MSLSKQYNPAEVEARLYQTWLEKGYFHADAASGKPSFCIVIPPPNITGQLHMGHALDNMMQDVLTRYKRMQGYEALWLPGTDHASIATELKIVEALQKEGLTKQDIGREAFMERAWAWRREYGGRIVEQLKKLGSSCDWSRERFTMDEGCSRAVKEVFCRLYEKGLIYRGDRIINWCPECRTALSDAEVEYAEEDGRLWHIRYPLAEGGHLTVATTRPETMLGDTAVAVNSADPRYAHLVGQEVLLPLTNRKIPIVADDYVEAAFGSGAVKITPAHDPNDFQVALRHNLPLLRVMNDDGTMNAEAGAYAELNRYEARKQVLQALTALNLLEKTEAHPHSVGHCYRCNETVEPILSKQWFVSMPPLAEPALRAAREGALSFVPPHFVKTYYAWLENIRDWCISRQLWWGHRIPAYYCEACGETVVSREEPAACPRCGHTAFRQDEDVLDTWFSSALWPFSTLGWPEATPDLQKFFPTSVLVTGYDIIFFWVARMVFSSLEFMGEVPFEKVLIHGLVRDAQGRKMSKSLGNGVEPLEIVQAYGADALRFSLAMGNAPGNDMRFYPEKVEASRNFANKIWNAARFVLLSLGDTAPGPLPQSLQPADKWILARYASCVADVTRYLDRFELGLAAERLYDFIWSDYCDWYIELCKTRLQAGGEPARQAAAVLAHVLSGACKLLHPFMPFITEEIWQQLGAERERGESILTAQWPEQNAAMEFLEEAEAFSAVLELIKSVRNLRAEMQVPMGKKTRLLVYSTKSGLLESKAEIMRLCYAQELELLTERPPAEGYATAVSAFGECYIPLGDLLDAKKELLRLQGELEKAEKEITFHQDKLNNPGFTGKAPAAVIEGVQKKLEAALALQAALCERIRSFSA